MAKHTSSTHIRTLSHTHTPGTHQQNHHFLLENMCFGCRISNEVQKRTGTGGKKNKIRNNHESIFIQRTEFYFISYAFHNTSLDMCVCCTFTCNNRCQEMSKVTFPYLTCCCCFCYSRETQTNVM